MTYEQLQREFHYRAAMSLVKELLKSRVISDEEYHLVQARVIKHFQPLLAGLYP